MTLKELHSEICALGFDDFLELDRRFLSSAERALLTVYNSSGITASTKFFVRCGLPKTRVCEINHKGGGAEALPLSGRAFSMRLYGKGRVFIEEKSKSYNKDFDCFGDYFKGFLESDATVYFLGELSYTVCDLVTFDEIFSEDANGIPNGDTVTVIDLREMLPDFLAFDSMPTDRFGKPIESAVLKDGKISLDASFSGEVSLVYRKRPILPSLDAPDAKIDIPSEYSMLLPLLAASYLLLDDEPEKAALYREMYEKNLLTIRERFRSSLGEKYVDTNGWA